MNAEFILTLFGSWGMIALAVLMWWMMGKGR